MGIGLENDVEDTLSAHLDLLRLIADRCDFQDTAFIHPFEREISVKVCSGAGRSPFQQDGGTDYRLALRVGYPAFDGK